MHRHCSHLRLPALFGGVLLLFGGAVDAWGTSICVYHGHDADEGVVNHAQHGAGDPHAGHALHAEHDGHHPTQDERAHHASHDSALGHVPGGLHDHASHSVHDPAAASMHAGSDHGDHECECRLRCVAVGAVPPLEPAIVEVPSPRPPQQDFTSPVELSTGPHAPATVPYLLPFPLAPPIAA